MYICEIHTLFMNIIANTVRHRHTSRPFFRIYPPVILAVRRRRTSHFCIFLSLFVTFGGFLRLFPRLSPSKIPICYIRTKRHRYEPSTLRFCCFCQIADCRGQAYQDYKVARRAASGIDWRCKPQCNYQAARETAQWPSPAGILYYILYNVCGAAIGLRRSLFYIFLADAIGITRRQFTASAASLARMGKLSSKAKELQQFLGSFDR